MSKERRKKKKEDEADMRINERREGFKEVQKI
jgi:hypothetical protein